MDGNQPTHIHDQADYQWPPKNWSGVCLFLCQTSLGHCRSKDSKPRNSSAERLLSERGFAPNTPNTVALPFLVQAVLCSHRQFCIPMKQFRTDLKHLWWERQLTFPIVYSSVQFFKHTISNTARNTGTFSHAAWAPKHIRLSINTRCPAWKAPLQKCPNLKCPTQQDTRQSSFESCLSSGTYRECRSSSPHPPNISHS